MAENRAAQLLAALAHAGLGDLSGSTEGDIRDALDTLLLAAARSGTSRTCGLPTDPPPADEEAPDEAFLQPESAADDSCDDPPAPEAGPEGNAPGTASVWLKDDSSSHSVPGRPLSIGRAPALPNALDIGRALRPLRRFRPSRVHRRLDLGATIDHYTRTGVLVPQLAPAAEPWLEVVVVVDRGTSMAVWDDTSLALTKVLRTLSAFRSVHVWHLEHPPEAAPVLRNHHDRPLPLDQSDPRHIQPAHRLLLVVSDCAAPAWRQNDLWQTLHTWGRTAPVALINPLPKRLWQRSGLDLPRTTATASTPASPGRLLAYRRPRLFRDDAPETRPWQALPVLQVDAHQILAWARAMMRTDPSGCEAVLVPASGRVPSRNRSPRPRAASLGAPATDTQVTAAAEAFTDNLRSPAVRLAIAASSLDAFTLPVLDVIRERIVPDAALADTAEFLTAGLLTAARHEDADIVYRFHPAAAEHLRGLLSRDQVWDTHFALTEHLAAHPQAPHGIVAALHSPTSQEMLPTGLQPVAQAAAATARLLGIKSTEPRSGPNEQASLPVESSDDENDDTQQAPAPAIPDDPSEPEPDREVAPDGPQIDGAVMLHVHQRDMLDRLHAEREIHGRHRNLLVAPPGTGKTFMAAFDYRHLREQHQRDLRLLFIAGTMEALHRAHRTYQGVLLTPEFGERLYSGGIPGRWNHVFATWHSLERVPDELPPDHFDVIVIDEFHGAGSPTFTNVLERFAPMELLGLSSAPERTDGPSIHDAFFDGRIAAEMRLRDALASDLLCPLHYFGIADGTDLQPLGWEQGTYDAASLKAVLTGNDARARLIVNAIRDTVPDVKAMRAVGFCVSVAHAEFMAQFFRSAGFHAMALTSANPATEREAALSSLRNGDLQVIFSVEMLSHGFSIPEVDTLLLLRPTSSGMRFLQQLGVGLAHSPGKRVLTVLDFIGHHRKEFRLDIQFRAMTHLTGKRLLNHVEHDFPRLPSGCMISLDEKAKILVIENLREQMQSTVTDTAREVAQYGELGLRQYLQESGRELSDLYRGVGTWTRALRRAGVLEGEAPEGETALLRRVRSFLHVDDPERVQAYTRMLEDDAPLYNDLDERSQTYARMLFFQLWPHGGVEHAGFSSYEDGFATLHQQQAVRSELRQVLAHNLENAARVPIPLTGIGDGHNVPLTIHSSYTRAEMLSALGLAQVGGHAPAKFAQGVAWCDSVKTDALFITLEEDDEPVFSPQSRLHDYALSRTLFHWESQSTTSETSSTGLRYRNHVEMGTSVLLFIRQYRSSDIGSSQPWVLLGPAEYVEHTGSRPMAIWWKLRHELPADVWSYAGIS
ncbi:DUF3427 domain-containing protein [Streptomyces colonosanans]|uniref:Helicase C-terminal domain-containing protein n=1 Tax=Streptomyces colonosanans TaxID=1428652 RepID=A0A1S2PMJ4_9ACTN|nr:DUF3427 domain-containing protein [Streptomyces colonosanans]OIJ95017.1 hypothetical protein BIV24_09745 [Streptomyces colonosanans]